MCVVIFVATAGRAGELESAKHRAEATADQLRAEGDWRSRVRDPPQMCEAIQESMQDSGG